MFDGGQKGAWQLLKGAWKWLGSGGREGHADVVCHMPELRRRETDLYAKCTRRGVATWCARSPCSRLKAWLSRIYSTRASFESMVMDTILALPSHLGAPWAQEGGGAPVVRCNGITSAFCHRDNLFIGQASSSIITCPFSGRTGSRTRFRKPARERRLRAPRADISCHCPLKSSERTCPATVRSTVARPT